MAIQTELFHARERRKSHFDPTFELFPQQAFADDAAISAADYFYYAAAESAVVDAGGTGYSVDDVLTLQGGTFGTAATFTVTAIGDSDAVETVELTTVGDYTVVPGNPVSTSVAPAGGSGCTLTVAWDTPDYRGSPITFKIDVEVTTQATATGTVFEIGDTNNGVAMAINTSGDLEAAAGPLTADDGVDGTASGLFGADGDRRSLVMAVLPGTGQLQVWADGDRVINETAVNGAFSLWANDSDGKVGDIDGTMTNRITAGLRVALANAIVVGQLLAYPNQLPRQFIR